jgi:hypothetical protein
MMLDGFTNVQVVSTPFRVKTPKFPVWLPDTLPRTRYTATNVRRELER